MLSRSIYNLMSMIRQGGTSAAATGQSLVDVMTHWHTMAIQLESEVEALREGQVKFAGSSASRTPAKPGPALRLVIDNEKGQS
ncbi:hypothetical protein ABWH89_04920 [Hoeflea alexandrii]|uniref:hypothetical protein n=1 Tax=Hoeflea alexandrii TaxID=288436 RepID=UPI0035D135E7